MTEYSIEVAVAGKSPDSGDFRLVFVGPATASGALPGDSAAEIADTDGRHAYVGVRGSNRVSALEVEAAGVCAAPGDGLSQRRRLAPAPPGPGRTAPRGPRTVRGYRDIPAGPGFRTAGLTPVGRLRVPSPTALVPAQTTGLRRGIERARGRPRKKTGGGGRLSGFVKKPCSKQRGQPGRCRRAGNRSGKAIRQAGPWRGRRAQTSRRPWRQARANAIP